MSKKVVTKSEQKLWDALAQELQKTFGQKREMEFLDLVRALKSIEMAYVEKFEGDPLAASETRKRVAELILYSAIDKGLEFAECQRLFNDLVQLGFSDLERKSTITIIFSRYCLETKHRQQGVDLLKALESELQDAIRPIRLYKDLLKTTQEVLGLLRNISAKDS